MLAFDFSKPIVILAPMAGFSDAPMREIVSSFGVDGVVSEMIASQEWKTEKRGVAAKAHKGQINDDTVFVVQIAGRDPELVAETAKFAESIGAQHVDINMGCPAKKVTSGQTGGAALLREPDLLLRIIDRAANAVNIPVTVKTRLGWDVHSTHNIAPQMVNAGAQMLTIHGRTRAQKYTGNADHAAIRNIVRSVNVPVIANGDITSVASAQTALKHSSASGVMVGRAAVGQPWLPAQIRAELSGETHPIAHDEHMILSHYRRIIEHYGEEMGIRAARKHLNAYFPDIPKAEKQSLLTETSAARVIAQLAKLINSQELELA